MKKLRLRRLNTMPQITRLVRKKLRFEPRLMAKLVSCASEPFWGLVLCFHFPDEESRERWRKCSRPLAKLGMNLDQMQNSGCPPGRARPQARGCVSQMVPAGQVDRPPPARTHQPITELLFQTQTGTHLGSDTSTALPGDTISSYAYF